MIGGISIPAMPVELLREMLDNLVQDLEERKKESVAIECHVTMNHRLGEAKLPQVEVVEDFSDTGEALLSFDLVELLRTVREEDIAYTVDCYSSRRGYAVLCRWERFVRAVEKELECLREVIEQQKSELRRSEEENDS